MAAVESFSLTVGGREVPCRQSFEVIDPATGRQAGIAPDASESDLDHAVDAARAAYRQWRDTSIEQRRAALRAIADALNGQAEELAQLLTREQGKPLADAEAEIRGSAYWCQMTATLDLPVLVTENTAQQRSETHRTPIGVVGAISPWNYPVFLAMCKVAPALLAGNTVILKPSPFTPLTTLKIGALLRGKLPAGVFNVIAGGDALGPRLTSHPGIDKISFTGSTKTGRLVMNSASATLKRLTLELGGNDAAIVLPDADVAKAAEQLFWSAFRNAGQTCIAPKRIYVHESIRPAFLSILTGLAADARVAPGTEAGAQIGPVQNSLQFERLKNLLSECHAGGFRFLSGGTLDAAKPGYFVPVSIIDSPPEESRIVQEEQFGPVLPVMSFAGIEDAIARANAGPFGLGASLWTQNAADGAKWAGRLEAGTVWINTHGHLSPFAAFGGVKQSGVGAENGVEGLVNYTQPQTIVTRFLA